MRALAPEVRLFQFLMANYASSLGVTDSDALYQGTTLEAAEKLIGLKGTGFSPSVIILE